MLTVEPSRSNYTYDYQLVQKEGQFEEKRTLLEENGVDKHEKNAQLKNIPFVSKCLIFGPVGFLSRYWQGYFHYSVLGEETIHGRACVIVKAVPKKPMMENNNRARIWLDRENQSVLRIEWEPESFGYEEKTVVRASNLKRQTVVCRVDFDIEKNGVRFPSRQVFREVARGSKKGDETILSEVKYKYSNYKFFTVGVDVKY
jgi:outer membrane lipoprotein-sorting protein